MTLGRLVLAWVPVAAWFMIATFAIPLLVAALWNTTGQPASGAAGAAPVRTWRLVEAAVLTLFASLWFDSLGSGGWWLLFLLVGVLVAVPAWLPAFASAVVPRRAAVAGVCADVARYILAGAILAWRLG